MLNWTYDDFRSPNVTICPYSYYDAKCRFNDGILKTLWFIIFLCDVEVTDVPLQLVISVCIAINDFEQSKYMIWITLCENVIHILTDLLVMPLCKCTKVSHQRNHHHVSLSLYPPLVMWTILGCAAPKGHFLSPDSSAKGVFLAKIP